MSRSRLLGEDIRKFALGGNATFTLVSNDTKRYFTFKMVQAEDNPVLYFVRLLFGANNTKDYRYVGCYYSDTNTFYPIKEYRNREKYTWPASMRAIGYFLDHLDNMPDKLIVYHEGKCARCGRKLTTPDSISCGFGPECRRLI